MCNFLSTPFLSSLLRTLGLLSLLLLGANVWHRRCGCLGRQRLWGVELVVETKHVGQRALGHDLGVFALGQVVFEANRAAVLVASKF